MNKLSQIVQSRTFWTIVVLVGINSIPVFKSYLNQSAFDLINAVLGAVATYFHVFPQQDYNS